MTAHRVHRVLAICALFVACTSWGHAAQDVSVDVNVAVAPARCGPGSLPETGLQGQVPLQDRLNGRSRQGYRCNLELVGQYQGEGTGTMLAGAGVGTLLGAGKLDLYDITDCAHPRLLNGSDAGDSLPVTNVAHEGEWSPDGKTYWTSGLAGGTLSAIDVSNPAKPKNIYFGGSSIFVNHGMSFNADGARMYLASIFPAGMVILDVSDIQYRKASNRRVKQIARITWQDGATTQRAVPVTIQGRPYLIAIDEVGAQSLGGGIRFIDISDETNPVIVSHIRLAI